MLHKPHLLVGGVNEHHRDLGPDNLDDQTRQTRPGAEIDHAQGTTALLACGIDRGQQAQRIGDQAVVDLIRFADGGQVEPLVPAKQEIAIFTKLTLCWLRQIAQQLRAYRKFRHTAILPHRVRLFLQIRESADTGPPVPRQTDY